MRNEYIRFNVYEAPKSPKEAGRFIRSFNYVEHAERFVQNSNRRGWNFFIKGVKEDGTEVVFI